MEIALIENVQRADLNPIEEAQAFQQLIQEFHLTQEEIANRVSKNRATITNSMRLLKLDIRVQDMLAEGKISSGHARALLGLEEGERQYQVAAKIIEEKLSVRDVEKLVKMMNRPPKEKKPEKGPDIDLIYRQVEDKLKSIMGTKVVINPARVRCGARWSGGSRRTSRRLSGRSFALFRPDRPAGGAGRCAGRDPCRACRA